MTIGIRISGDVSMVEQRLRAVAGRQFLDQFSSEQSEISVKDLRNLRAYMSAVICNKDTLTDKNAIKLLLMTPLLFYGAKNASAVHDAIFVAGNQIKKLYQERPNDPLAKQSYNALIIAGKMCFNPRLPPTGSDRRKFEFELFEPFVGQTKHYQSALDKFKKRNCIGLSKLSEFYDDPNSVKQPYVGIVTHYSQRLRG